MTFDEPTTKDGKLQARMAVIVELNRRRDSYIMSRNRDGLLELAAEYHARGMTNTAKEVRREADKI